MPAWQPDPMTESSSTGGDEIINPDSSVLLSGATNTGVGCLGHSDLHSNAGVFDQVRAFVA